MKKIIFLSFLALLTLCVTPVKSQVVTPSDIYTEINAYRATHGLPELQVSQTLEISSSVYALNLKVTGRQKHAKLWFAAHNRLCGEVLSGQVKPVQGWKESSPHNRVLLTKGFTHFGLGKSGRNYVLRFIQKT